MVFYAMLRDGMYLRYALFPVSFLLSSKHYGVVVVEKKNPHE